MIITQHHWPDLKGKSKAKSETKRLINVQILD